MCCRPGLQESDTAHAGSSCSSKVLSLMLPPPHRLCFLPRPHHTWVGRVLGEPSLGLQVPSSGPGLLPPTPPSGQPLPGRPASPFSSPPHSPPPPEASSPSHVPRTDRAWTQKPALASSDLLVQKEGPGLPLQCWVPCPYLPRPKPHWQVKPGRQELGRGHPE